MHTKERRLVIALAALFLLICALSLLIPDKPGIKAQNKVSEEEMSQGFGEAYDAESIEAGEILNINTADAKQLQRLPGIGEKTAQNIIDYRAAHGDFERIDDIKNVDGIGDGKFENMKEFLTVSG